MVQETEGLSLLPVDAPLGQLLYHYTSAEKGLDYVLAGGTIRLSPFATMNDPREAKEWTVTVTTSDPEYGGVDLNEITERFNAELKGKVKVACFTADHTPEGRTATPLDRGWAHPRMWASYATNHAGVCLAFRREQLLERFASAFDGAASLVSGRVTYSDADPLATPAFRLNAADVRRRGLDDVLREHAQRYSSDLFLTKLTDWATENEYRLLLQGGDTDPAYLDFGDALAAVCVGHHWDPRRDGDLLRACKERNVQVCQVWWRNGHPDITEYMPEPND